MKLKLNPVRRMLEGQRVILVDDSIVRGTTSRKDRPPGARRGRHGSPRAHQLPADDFALLLRSGYAAARGINRREPDDEEIRQFLGADSLGYLSLESLRAAVEDTAGNFCTSCYTGSYPTELVQLEVEAHRGS